QTSTSGLTNSIFGNAPFSSNSQTHSTSSNVAQKFPVHQQAPMFSSQPFPTQFPSNSNPFQQQPFGPSITYSQNAACNQYR
ncbi:unnamed protein product, partial [Rotaria magnacalcarata]